MGLTDWAQKDGEFKRQVSSFREHITEGGKHPAEKDRYHLYVSYACPWAHRALILRALKGLEDIITVSVVHPHLLEGGWHFVPYDLKDTPPAPMSEHNNKTFPGATIDDLHHKGHLRELYELAEPEYSARWTVPVLWDKKLNTIVSNESSEIIRDLTFAFDSLLPDGPGKELNTFPEELRKEIEEFEEWSYNDINNGVYKSGFATSQEAYNKAAEALAKALDRVEGILSDGREYLIGGRLTEADVRLYTTIVRYDPVYYVHFKCNWGSIRHDYPNINRWLKNLYWNNPAFKETTNFEHIKEHYFYSHTQINPFRIVPYGPNVDIEPLDDSKRKAEGEDGARKAAKV
ncbi:hypothetical protein VHUM_03099 [Vanrija humicola]|uniref:Glutathione S-transferase omega-like 2 n=1 Tax=Vanrija humicola TaxID=5417 RepID=A0A7D8YWX8_VANHU|nr:hypothetical protein VHUM_03099 [Vanrija humicola]